MEFGIIISGTAQEIQPFLDSIAKLVRDNNKMNVTDAIKSVKPTGKLFNPGEDGYYIQLVWDKITAKAKKSLLYIATHDGCTKEEIVRGLGGVLADTRDLGGALSSVSRRCSSLYFNQNVVYEKIETSSGPRYYMAESTADAIKILGQDIDDTDPPDAVAGDPDGE